MYNQVAEPAVMKLTNQKINKGIILKIKMPFKKKITKSIKIMIKI